MSYTVCPGKDIKSFPKMGGNSWLDIRIESPFSLENIPFGVVSRSNATGEGTIAVAIGDYVLLMDELAEGGAFIELPLFQRHLEVFANTTLNAFAALGRALHREVRSYIRDLLLKDTKYPSLLKDNVMLKSKAIHPRSEFHNMLPMRIGDYTDFYAGLEHAYNVGVLFRGPKNALQPNYKHLPVGYHGRASTIRPSGIPVRRPYGQFLSTPGDAEPIFSPCKKLDIELELAAFVCKSNPLDTSIGINDSEEYIFGYVLMNDWSARDIQAWEYVPLGPFNSKNFATTISPWVVLADALGPFRCKSLLEQSENKSSLLPYLREHKEKPQHNIELYVDLKLAGTENYQRISTSNSAYLLYSFNQMLAHHTITGCQMNVGDLLGSGTISGPTTSSMGSLLEMTENGKEPLHVGPSNIERFWLGDGDEVRMSGLAGQEGSYVGFGDCQALILPARNPLDCVCA